jgi:peptide/nickel transport system permease protein
MLPYIIRRLVIAVPLLFLSTFLTFVMVVNSGRPQPFENALLNPATTPQDLRELEIQFNLDDPVIVRYWDWLSDAVTGDLGDDNAGRAVLPQIGDALGYTLRLVLVAQIVAVIIAVVVGAISALRQYSAFDYAATFSAFLFFSLPVFWLAVLLKQFLAIELNELFGSTIVYTVGAESVDLPDSFFGRIADYAGHMALPVLTLVLISYAAYSRYTRSSMLDVLSTDYIRTARAKGVPRSRVVARHALRNALIPLTTVVALNFGVVLGGAIITERVFQWRGMGTLFIEGILQYDVNLVQGWLIVTAITVVVFNLIADVLYAYLDPRIRL